MCAATWQLTTKGLACTEEPLPGDSFQTLKFMEKLYFWFETNDCEINLHICINRPTGFTLNSLGSAGEYKLVSVMIKEKQCHPHLK